jgi:hypothetical protein
MAQFLSGRRTNFNVGVSSFTENTTSLQVIGNVGVGTTNAGGRSLYVIGDAEVSGNISANTLVGTSLSLSGISTLNAISAGGTTGISQYVLTSTGTGLIWQASTTLTGVTGINVAEDATDGLKYLGMQAGAGTTQVTHISSNELVYNSNTKNLGIGTTNPISKLTVQGDVKVSGVVTATEFHGILSGYASTAGIATYATDAGISTYATYAGYASTAGIATYATDAGISTYATKAGIATNIEGGAKNYIPYQTGVNTTGFIAYGNPGDILTTDGADSAPYWSPLNVGTVVGQITVKDEGNIVGTALSITQLDFRGQNIVATANIGGNIATITVADYVSISGYSSNAGIATNVIGGIASVSSLFVNTNGISTLGTVKISSGIVTASSPSGIVTYYGEFVGDVTGYASSSGIATNVIGGIASVSSLFVNTTGISTLGTVKISSGIVTASSPSGIVTYYGEFVGNISNLAGGDIGNIPYQNSTGITSFLINGPDGSLLQSNGIGATPSWTSSQGLTIGYANTAGIATDVIGGIASVSSLFVNTNGISTLGTVKISSGIVTASSPSGIVTYYGQFVGDVTGYASSSGIATNVIGGIASVSSLFVNTTGISTLGTVKISSGIVTASSPSGIVTYYGEFVGSLTGTISSASYATTAFNLHGFDPSNVSAATSVRSVSANVVQYPTFVSGTGSTAFVGINKNLLTFIPINNGFFGIGTTSPTTNLHVIGSGRFTSSVTAGSFVGAALSISGISTVGTGNTGVKIDGTTGIITSISGLTTITYYGDGSKLGGLIPNTINNIDVNQIYYPLLSPSISGTISSIGVSSTSIVFNPGPNYLGIGTTNPTANLDVIGNVKISGVSTLGTVKISSGIVTASSPSGVVTYYGDGSKLTGVAAGTATTATDLADGAQGSLPYQDAPGSTVFLSAPASTNQVLLYSNGTNQPVWSKVGLGTNTTGNYVKSISGTANEIEVTGGTGEGSTPTVQFVNSPIIQGTLQVNTDLNVLGNITIGGTANRIIAQDLVVLNKDIILGFSTDIAGNEVSTDFSATGGGIAIASTEGSPLVNINAVGFETTPITYKKIMWFRANDPFVGLNTDAWLSNYAFGIGTTSMPAGTRFAAGNVTISQDDITSVRNINASGITTVGAGNTGVKIDGTTGIITSISGLTTITYYGNLVGSASTAGYARTAFTLNDRTESQFNVSYAQTAGISTNLVGGAQGSLPYQDAPGSTSFVSAGGNNEVLLYDTALNKPYWGSASAATGSFGGISVQDETNPVGTANSIKTLNFVGENIRATATTGANGIATITIADNLVGTALSISGISTLGTVKISSGIVTASSPSGVVTYYGDGSKLSNIISGVSISTNTTNQAQYLIYVPETGSTTGFGVTTTGLVVNPSNNSLGIGTSNPTANLHVLGNLLVAAGSSTGQHITQKAYELNNGTLSWEGTAGQLFSITNNLTSDSIFSVNDVSGIPSIDVDANGIVSLGAYGGNIGIGTTLPTSKLTVRGDVLVSGISTFSNGPVLIGTGTSTGTASQPLQVTGGAYVSGNLGINTASPSERLQVNGNISINGNVSYGSITTTTATTSQTNIYSNLSSSTYRSVEYTIQATQGTNYHATKILTIHNGTTTYNSEYGTVYNNTLVGAFDVDISGGNIRLLVTPASSSSTTYTVNFVATKI